MRLYIPATQGRDDNMADDRASVFRVRLLLHTSVYRVLDLVYGCLALGRPRNCFGEPLEGPVSSRWCEGRRALTSFSNMHLLSARSGFRQ